MCTYTYIHVRMHMHVWNKHKHVHKGETLVVETHLDTELENEFANECWLSDAFDERPRWVSQCSVCAQRSTNSVLAAPDAWARQLEGELGGQEGVGKGAGRAEGQSCAVRYGRQEKCRRGFRSISSQTGGMAVPWNGSSSARAAEALAL